MAAARERRSIGPGAHGERVYGRTAITLDPARQRTGWRKWLAVHRQTEAAAGQTKKELGFYRRADPTVTPLRKLSRGAVGDRGLLSGREQRRQP
jgi:hypothetical protein